MTIRLEYNISSNAPPKAVISTDKITGAARLVVQLKGSDSFDRNGSIFFPEESLNYQVRSHLSSPRR